MKFASRSLGCRERYPANSSTGTKRCRRAKRQRFGRVGSCRRTSRCVSALPLAVMARLKQVFKITYPNGRIYVGSDLTGSISYFGSPGDKAKARIAADLGPQGCREFTATKTILWESETATKAETLDTEREWITRLGANNPAIGYNGSPRFRLD